MITLRYPSFRLPFYMSDHDKSETRRSCTSLQAQQAETAPSDPEAWGRSANDDTRTEAPLPGATTR